MPSFKDRRQQKRVEWAKIFDIFQGKYTGLMFERQAAILERLSKVHQDGIRCQGLKDLECVAELLRLTKEKILNGGDGLVPSLLKYLLICRQPFLDDKDEKSVTELQSDLLAFTDALTDLLNVENQDITTHVSELCGGPKLECRPDPFIAAAPSKEGGGVDWEMYSTPSQEADADLLAIMEKTQIVPHFTKALERQDGAPAQLTILRILRRMSASTAACCQMVAGTNVTNVRNVFAALKLTRGSEGTLEIFGRAISDTKDDAHLSIIVEILWNVLERQKETKAASVLGSKDFAIHLHTLFRYLSINGHRQAERQLRNEMVIICISVAVHEPQSLDVLADIGFVDMFWRFLAHGELELEHEDVAKNVTEGASDYEFKRLGLVLVKVLCRTDRNLNLFMQAGLMDFMFMYLDYKSANPVVMSWTLRQIKGLQLQILSLLDKLIPSIQPTFSASSGNTRLLSFLRMAMEKDCGADEDGFHSANPHEEEALLLAAVECIWGAVCGGQANEATFFKNGGIFALLDLLESFSVTMKRHTLGCLLDLVENPKARHHLLEWRTNKNEQRGIGHLLIDLWEAEESKLGVPQGVNGMLLSREKPLRGIHHPQRMMKSRRTDEDSPAIGETSENLRAKIYSLFCKLGFDEFHQSLSVQHRVKLTLISKYLDFKLGEVWEEISDELDYDGIRPVSPDLECVMAAKGVVVEKAERVVAKQQDIVRRQQERNREEEVQFYEIFKQRESMKRRAEGSSNQRDNRESIAGLAGRKASARAARRSGLQKPA
ncbi:hypothetical protein HK104_004956 [Borealophlyctis nickersoniae]|nr:hypothetical protein HK104_004956 [Borealophlyctis nickersoniae]